MCLRKNVFNCMCKASFLVVPYITLTQGFRATNLPRFRRYSSCAGEVAYRKLPRTVVLSAHKNNTQTPTRRNVRGLQGKGGSAQIATKDLPNLRAAALPGRTGRTRRSNLRCRYIFVCFAIAFGFATMQSTNCNPMVHMQMKVYE